MYKLTSNVVQAVQGNWQGSVQFTLMLHAGSEAEALERAHALKESDYGYRVPTGEPRYQRAVQLPADYIQISSNEDPLKGERDTPLQSKPNLSVSPALPLSSPAGGMLPEGAGYTDTQHGQMVRQLKQFTSIHGEQFFTDCLNGRETKYIKQHREKQVVEPLAKWVRRLASK
jgi:hypothetical protein